MEAETYFRNPKSVLWKEILHQSLESLQHELLFIYFFPSVISFIFFFFKFCFIFKLYIIVLVMPNIIMNPPQVYMSSPS